MQKRANDLLLVGALVALGLLIPIASLATDAGKSAGPAKQAGEDRWVPSLAITSGATIQQQQGLVDSCLFSDDMTPADTSCNSRGTPPDPALRGLFRGDDLSVAPFVGGSLELMTPALPIPTRPRIFLSGEILPTFASDRDLAVEGNPGCVRGPKPDAPCAKDEDGSRRTGFGDDAVNGTGSRTSARIDTLVFGANLGVAFPLQIGKRQVRLKPSVGWINYKVEADGFVVDADCDPLAPFNGKCTEFTPTPGFPSSPGFLRETTLADSASQRFNGIGPGLDIEMDTGQFGPLGVSLFMGGRAYAIVGDRTISLDAVANFTDQLSDPGATPPVMTDRAAAQFEVKVDPWIYRAHVGIRFHWLGSRE